MKKRRRFEAAPLQFLAEKKGVANQGRRRLALPDDEKIQSATPPSRTPAKSAQCSLVSALTRNRTMATRTNLVGTLGFLLLTTIGPNVAAEKNTVATSTATTTVEAGKLSVASVESLLAEKKSVYIFDANGRESYLAGHVPGAQWIEYDAVAKAKLPKAKDAMLVFYCYNPLCGTSPRAAKDAIGLGYSNVAHARGHHRLARRQNAAGFRCKAALN